MDATELLKKDHDKVRALFQQFRGGGGISGLVKRVTGNVDARERRAAVQKVCNELDLHARIEEEIFYPAVRALGDPDLNKQLEEATREHGTVKQEVAAIRAMRNGGREAGEGAGEGGAGEGGGGGDLDELMTKLEECVEHHATEEEREMFPRVQELMPEAQREEIGRRLQARKRGGASAASSTRTATSRRSAGTTAAKSRTRTGATAKTGTKTTAAAARRTTGRGRTATSAKKGKAPKRARGGRRR
jgi:iron-sulfur cluster repair protein YtfE (RIC family)